MKSILKWNLYQFMVEPCDGKSIVTSPDKLVTIVAPTFVEAVNTFHEVTHIEPYSVTCVGRCFLLDSDLDSE